MKEALLYEKLDDEKVRCDLCDHRCLIHPSKRGICSVRENRGGVLYSLVYSHPISANVDPIEKKPLFHFLPGTTSFSIATVGCNFTCGHCQNYSISQPPEKDIGTGQEVPAERIVALAKNYGCQSISYTYTEPTIFFEYAYDTAKIATSEGLRNIFVTNGYMTREALQTINSYLHAANIDLKSFNNQTYLKICSAKLTPVLESIKLMKDMGIWVEVTTLIIPTINDSSEELTEIADFLVSVGKDIPWHISRFYPHYKMTSIPPTPVETLHHARQIGLNRGLRYVYSGTVPGDEGEKTYCYQCKELLIDRYGYQILKNITKDSKCPKCRAAINKVWG